MANDEIKYLENRMKADKKEIERLRRKGENDEMAEQIHEIYQSLLDKGFSENDAWDLLVLIVKKAWGMI